MKAKIVRLTVYEGAMDWIHGGGRKIKRLVVEEASNLAITLFDGQVHAFTGFNLKEEDGCEVIGEIEAPDELIEKALAFIRAKDELNGLKSQFEAWLI
ncbi:MAG: hypothetical protein A3B15_00095 [Candidatus Buchananbacteria bacterium RIFCSPLOWO2_01_FULL_45_31]|uniref:Uncharacterized protein n=1 Tax=Candidatus Buchananbacteria bacterium RIFCSPLOWO2_01_FULL_45_31 TaxID=1797545 RepID=A0A1G1YQY6_9BACT|nr:MAG: hypothetical protein A3B15_00095 [Candidatus Buchananbacteria bacterium RIFCSPLOWO2_01_FULL_45_31]